MPRRTTAIIATTALAITACSGGDDDTISVTATTATTVTATSAAPPTTAPPTAATPTTAPPTPTTAPPTTTPAEVTNEVTVDELPDLPDLALVSRGAAILEVSSEWDTQDWTSVNLLDGNPDRGWSSTEQGGSVTIGLAHDDVAAVAFDTRAAQDVDFPGISALSVFIETAVDPLAFPDLEWEPVGTITIPPNSIGLLDTPGLITPYLRFTITEGGTASFAEIMEIMVYGQLQTDRQISFELMQTMDALAAPPVGVEFTGDQWNFSAIDGAVIGCSVGGASANFAPSEGGLVGEVVRADGSTAPAIMSVLTIEVTMIVDPDGSPAVSQAMLTPEGGGCTPGETVDDEVVVAQTTPEDQREADPLIIVAAARGDVEEVQAQLAAGVNPNIAQESRGWTALLFAAQDGYTDVANVLLQAGADVDRGSDDGWTPLMIASQNGHADTVEALLAGGANPRVGRSSNWTALHSATFRNRPGVVAQLIAAGAPLEAAEDGFTPLTIGAQEGNDAVLESLIAAGARVDGNPAAGPTPLYMAVQNNNATSAQILLAAGADPSNGGTSDPPMVTAGARDRLEIVPILVAGGANIDQQRGDGFTALHWAAYRDNAEMVQLLVDLGADTSVTDNDDNTPLDIAIRRDNDAAAAVLR